MVARSRKPRRVTASQLRADVYRILDRIIESGEPVEIERNGKVLRIVREAPPDNLARLVHRPDAIIGDPESIVHMDWSKEWRP